MLTTTQTFTVAEVKNQGRRCLMRGCISTGASSLLMKQAINTKGKNQVLMVVALEQTTI